MSTWSKGVLDRQKAKAARAAELQGRGLTLAEIARALDYSSPTTVCAALARHKARATPQAGRQARGNRRAPTAAGAIALLALGASVGEAARILELDHSNLARSLRRLLAAIDRLDLMPEPPPHLARASRGRPRAPGLSRSAAAVAGPPAGARSELPQR